MENKNLFRIDNEGYRCEDVEKYIDALKAEYKKVFEYAKNTESTNEKLKKICRALQDENKNLKSAAPASAAHSEASANNVSADFAKIAGLAKQLSDEIASFESKIKES